MNMTTKTNPLAEFLARRAEEHGRASIVSIKFDVDAYLARGGKLLDLIASVYRDLHDFECTLLRMAKKEHIARFDRWMNKVSALGSPHERIGDKLTEDQLQRLWADTP
jgi:hypothetical protein